MGRITISVPSRNRARTGYSIAIDGAPGLDDSGDWLDAACKRLCPAVLPNSAQREMPALDA